MTDQASKIDLQHELTDGTAARMVRAKAKRLVGHQRLRSEDQRDIEQELMIAVFEAFPTFDAEVACWPAFVATIVERHASRILRDRKAQKRNPPGEVVSLSTHFVESEGGGLVPLSDQIGGECRELLTGEYRLPEAELTEFQVEVNDIVSGFPAELRDICERLSHQTVAEIARDLRIPRRTLRDRICDIRRRFVEAGFEDFPEKAPPSRARIVKSKNRGV